MDIAAAGLAVFGAQPFQLARPVHRGDSSGDADGRSRRKARADAGDGLAEPDQDRFGRQEFGHDAPFDHSVAKRQNDENQKGYDQYSRNIPTIMLAPDAPEPVRRRKILNDFFRRRFHCRRCFYLSSSRYGQGNAEAVWGRDKERPPNVYIRHIELICRPGPAPRINKHSSPAGGAASSMTGSILVSAACLGWALGVSDGNSASGTLVPPFGLAPDAG
ncbi:hypothetical protein [Bosea sp. (in: a-proteobacteria)]|uniref:hypothetical protein n=1 Tax=Bosea sp. (in: a-proteobacteria) TaxID=1871050 RepID=UPI002613B84E|nr:hypothetical protein [Bosea sp. (in: a-proteobacteria)]MCO5089731.1 hypothetical protein [Bosea sp. (in: a-proteobacteria)]